MTRTTTLGANGPMMGPVVVTDCRTATTVLAPGAGGNPSSRAIRRRACVTKFRMGFLPHVFTLQLGAAVTMVLGVEWFVTAAGAEPSGSTFDLPLALAADFSLV